MLNLPQLLVWRGLLTCVPSLLSVSMSVYRTSVSSLTFLSSTFVKKSSQMLQLSAGTFPSLTYAGNGQVGSKSTPSEWNEPLEIFVLLLTTRYFFHDMYEYVNVDMHSSRIFG